MDKADARVELRVPCQTLFNARHPDQNQTDSTVVKGVPHLLQPRHFEPICFVDNQ